MDKKAYLKYKKKNNKKDNDNKYTFKTFLFNMFIKTLFVIVLFLGAVIFVKYDNNNKKLIKNVVYKKSLSFAKIYNLYQKYIGDALSTKSNEETLKVSSNEISYTNYKKENNGFIIDVNDTLMPAIKSGVVISKKKSNTYDYLVTIQDKDGVNITYGMLNDTDIKLYEYVKKDEVLGSIKNKVYLIFEKDGKYLSYEEFL